MGSWCSSWERSRLKSPGQLVSVRNKQNGMCLSWRSRAVPSDGCFPECSAPWGAEGQGWDGAERRLLLPAPRPDFSFLLEAKWCPAGWLVFSPLFCSPVCVCVAGRGLRLGEVSTGKGDRERRWELGLFSPFWRCCFWRSSGSVPGRGLLAWVCLEAQYDWWGNVFSEQVPVDPLGNVTALKLK